MSAPRPVRAPRGSQLTCKTWQIEAIYRMIQNNLDPEVAERPDDLVVYGGRGQAARSWEAFDAILDTLKEMEADETLLVQSGKPVAVFKTHLDAPRALIANSNLVPHWATQAYFDELSAKGLIMYLRNPGFARTPARMAFFGGQICPDGWPGRYGRRTAPGGDDE